MATKKAKKGLKIKGYVALVVEDKKAKNRDLSFWLVGQENKESVKSEGYGFRGGGQKRLK